VCKFEGDRGAAGPSGTGGPKPTYDGWAWLSVYVLGPNSEAIERRNIFVQVAGLLPLVAAPSKAPSRPLNAGPAQRTPSKAAARERQT
jgi:hypothetical protein